MGMKDDNMMDTDGREREGCLKMREKIRSWII